MLFAVLVCEPRLGNKGSAHEKPVDSFSQQTGRFIEAALLYLVAEHHASKESCQSSAPETCGLLGGLRRSYREATIEYSCLRASANTCLRHVDPTLSSHLVPPELPPRHQLDKASWTKP